MRQISRPRSSGTRPLQADTDDRREPHPPRLTTTLTTIRCGYPQSPDDGGPLVGCGHNAPVSGICAYGGTPVSAIMRMDWSSSSLQFMRGYRVVSIDPGDRAQLAILAPSPRRRTIMKRIFSALSIIVIMMTYLSAACAQASQETGTGFPISKGSYWVYSGTVKGRESQQDCDGTKPAEQAITWKMEVMDTIDRGNITAAVLKGHPF